MKKTSNKNASQYVYKQMRFKANNLSGETVIKNRVDGYGVPFASDKLYVVKSYGYYPIFIYSFQTEKWYETEDRYSVSTARQMTQVRPTGAQVIKHSYMEQLIRQPKDEVNIVRGFSSVKTLSKYEETIEELSS
jgi:hypothetical protein|tara:strand:- start:61 stop:462 length:402 start_codon:yes stop_codon:yes gene_type:complete